MVQSGLLARWPLNELGGRATDVSGNDNHGAVTGAPLKGAAGRGGLNATYFDGSDDEYNFSEFGTDFHGTELTVSAWVNFSYVNGGTRQSFLSFDGATTHWYFEERNGKLRGEWRSGTGTNEAVTSNQDVRRDTWYHVVYRYSSDHENNHIQIFVDGEFDGRGRGSDAAPDGAQNAAIIGAAWYGDRIDGFVQDVRVYNRALSAAEIKRLYEMGSADITNEPSENDPGAVSRWSFDNPDDSGKYEDDWGSNDAILQNQASFNDFGVRGYSLSLDGTDDYAEVPDDTTLDITNAITLSCWVNVDDTADYPRAITKATPGAASSEPYLLAPVWNSVAEPRFMVNGASQVAVDSNVSINATTWHHIAGTYDGSTAKVFVNGVPTGSTDGSVTINTSTDPVLIGTRENNGTENLDGFIEDVRIYDRALSEHEVRQLYMWGSRGIDQTYELIQQ